MGNDSENSNNTSASESGDETQVGDVFQTDHFAITVNSIRVENRVRTGNQFADLPVEAGNLYLIINATFRNTDTESRTLFDEGTVLINHEGRQLRFENANPS